LKVGSVIDEVTHAGILGIDLLACYQHVLCDDEAH